MKKIILTILFAFIANFTFGNENYVSVSTKNNIIITDSVSNIVVNIPSTIKVFKSENDKIYMRIRTLQEWLLKEITYNIEDDRIIIKPKRNIDFFDNDENVIIYLFAPDNVNLTTSNDNLLVKNNTIKANDETKR